MYVQGYLQGSENGRVVTIDWLPVNGTCIYLMFYVYHYYAEYSFEYFYL